MSHFDHLPDEATRLTAESLRSHFMGVSRHPTAVGWLGRYALLVLVLGGGAAFFSLLAPVLYALMQ